MYSKLKTANFLKSYNKQQHVDYHILRDILKTCYQMCCFSTFPYFNDGFSSKKSLREYHSGNCITLSLCLKEILLKHGIESFLIPATIPKTFYREGYLDVSHVALAVPKNNNELYILDAAFYFIEPLYLNISQNYTTQITSSRLYDDSQSVIESQIHILDKQHIYNKYQTIPKDTILCIANYQRNPSDKWHYILRRVINPDEAISNFFINIIKFPHITTTYLDENGICKMNIYIKFINQDTIKITIRHTEVYRGPVNEIPHNLLSYITSEVSQYFKDHLSKHLKKKLKKTYHITD